MIHLALHGYVDPEIPDRSALVFAPQQQAGDDGLLQIRDIRNLHLKQLGTEINKSAALELAPYQSASRGLGLGQ